MGGVGRVIGRLSRKKIYPLARKNYDFVFKTVNEEPGIIFNTSSLSFGLWFRRLEVFGSFIYKVLFII